MNQDTTYFSLCKNSISGAAVQHRKNHYHFSKHLHTSVEIYLIKSGTCVMTIGNTTIECKPDDFIMIPPNVVHSFYLTDENECSFYHIHFFPEFLSHITLEEDSSVNLMHSLIFCCAPFHQQKTTKELKELILAIIRLYNTRILRYLPTSIYIFYSWFCSSCSPIRHYQRRSFQKKYRGTIFHLH